MRIEFEPNGDNVGEYDNEGAVMRWPTRDSFGGVVPTVNRKNVTTKRIDATHFAVIPVGRDDGEMDFVWKSQPAVPYKPADIVVDKPAKGKDDK